MDKNISEWKNLPSTFVILDSDPGSSIATEITEAFSEFVLTKGLIASHLSNPEIIAVREMWEDLKQESIEEYIEWLARKSFPPARWWPTANLCFTKSLILRFPDYWIEFKKNCGGMPGIYNYLKLI